MYRRDFWRVLVLRVDCGGTFEYLLDQSSSRFSMMEVKLLFDEELQTWRGSSLQRILFKGDVDPEPMIGRTGIVESLNSRSI